MTTIGDIVRIIPDLLPEEGQCLTPDQADNARGALTNIAQLLGMEIHGWIIPNASLPVSLQHISDENDDRFGEVFYVCPHCDTEQTEMLTLEDGSATLTLDTEAPVGLPTDTVVCWNGSAGNLDSETVGYQCPDCNGMLNPLDHIEWC